MTKTHPNNFEVKHYSEERPGESKMIIMYKGRGYSTHLYDERSIQNIFPTALKLVEETGRSLAIGQLPEKPRAVLVPMDSYLELRRIKEMMYFTPFTRYEDMMEHIIENLPTNQ